MFRNYLTIALRQLRKQTFYSAIKIGGFAIGICACLLIGLYIRHEISYDQTYPDAARIYRVVGIFNLKEGVEKGTSWPAPMALAIKKDLPEVEGTARLMPNSLFDLAGSNEVRAAGQLTNSHEDGFTYADGELLQMLQLPMKYGNARTALQAPHSLVLSRSKAEKYFPGQDPTGKTLLLNDDRDHPWTVGGVMEDLPSTSHLQAYDFWLTLKDVNFYEGEQTNWKASNYVTYVKVRAGADPVALGKKLAKDMLDNYYRPLFEASGDKQNLEMLKRIQFALQPVTDIHLRSYNIHDYLSGTGDIRFVWLFAGIAGFILLIACVNFINLSTAKSANRAKEVGLRKVSGSLRSSLVAQFLTESVLYSLLAFVVGVLLALGLLPLFNQLAGKPLTIPWTAWWLAPGLLLCAGITGMIAGFYPALYLSAFRPAEVLKGQVARGSKNSLLRNVLVVFQFTVSVILIVSTAIIYDQMTFILNKDVGYDKDQVILLKGTNTLGEKVKTLKAELLKSALVRSVSISDYLPVDAGKRNGNTFYKEGREKIDEGVFGQNWVIDADYLKTMGLQLVAGRNFSPDMPTDSQGVIINQTLATRLNLTDPIGKRITNGYQTPTPIIGVVKDFNFQSLRNNVEGLEMRLGLSSSIVSVKVTAGQVTHAIESVTDTWKKLSPTQAVRFSFLDESFAAMYADVQRMGRLFTCFSVLAILIACLGLFALSAFMAEQRYREIGIRKVLGASVAGITALLSRDFVRLVVISIIIAVPVSWWAMNKWLEEFAYRTPVSWWLFALAGLIAMAIALVTVSYQSIRAALMNPARSLKAE